MGRAASRSPGPPPPHAPTPRSCLPATCSQLRCVTYQVPLAPSSHRLPRRGSDCPLSAFWPSPAVAGRQSDPTRHPVFGADSKQSSPGLSAPHSAVAAAVAPEPGWVGQGQARGLTQCSSHPAGHPVGRGGARPGPLGSQKIPSPCHKQPWGAPSPR